MVTPNHLPMMLHQNNKWQELGHHPIVYEYGYCSFQKIVDIFYSSLSFGIEGIAVNSFYSKALKIGY